MTVGASALRAQTAWHEGFEEPLPTWREVGGNVAYRVEAHQRVRGEAHAGQGSEWIRVSGSGHGYVRYAHPVGRGRVIDELVASVWVKADRPGVQALVRVVLPRTGDPRTGAPLTTLLGGPAYAVVGRWEQLRVDRIAQRLAEQSRLLQAQIQTEVDVREAYVDHVLLNVYSGPGTTNVWIDDLAISGCVEPAGGAPRAALGEPSFSPEAGLARPASLGSGPSAVARGSEAGGDGRVKLVGSVLLADGRPVFPRAVEHQGEPLSLVRQLGFNAIWLACQPTREVLEEAERLGLWVICPPPLAPDAQPPGTPDAPQPLIGSGFDRVLAWDLGAGLTGEQYEAARQWAEQVRAADHRRRRPLICRPANDLWNYSRLADLVLVGRSPLGTSLELADYGTWVRERPRLARAGTPLWTAIQTQPSPGQVAQWSALARGEPLPSAAAEEQVRLLAYTAVVAGSRGLLFESDSPLDANDPDTRSRAAALELLNLELELLEPFAAAGQYVTAVQGSEAEVQAALLRTERARLLVPIWSGRGSQYVAGQAAANGVSFVMPGVPESHSVYELAPGGLRPLRHKRVTGGTRVTLDEFGLTALVLLTQDPLVVNSLTRRALAVGPRAAELIRQLAGDKLRVVEQTHARLSARTPIPQAAEWLGAARKNLHWADGLLAARDFAGAYATAQRAMRPLRLLERAHWQAAVGGLPSPVASPAAVAFRTLPWHQGLLDVVAASRGGGNLLPGGDFEDLDALLEAGWRHVQQPAPGVLGEADLRPNAAHSGRLGLRLCVRASQPDNASIVLETPPVWFTSPPLAVPPGAVVSIQGWVQVPAPITGSVDGLMVIDSLTGESLAERIDETAGWRRFALIRVVPQSGQVSVTFALSGLGEVWVDDVAVEVLQPAEPSGVTRLPPIQPLR